MVNHNKPLTSEQQRFAEEHHNLVEIFLKVNRLPELDYYDVVIFGYINAVRKYTERPELRAYAFSTIAQWSMLTALGNERRKEARRISTTSFDAENDDGLNLYGLIGTCDPDPDEVDGHYSAQYSDLLKALTRRQRTILTMKAQGLTGKEIAATLRIPVGTVESTAHRGRKALRQAEQARTYQIGQKVKERTGREIPLEELEELEAVARRRLATYKSNRPTYRRKDSAVVRMVAEAVYA